MNRYKVVDLSKGRTYMIQGTTKASAVKNALKGNPPWRYGHVLILTSKQFQSAYESKLSKYKK